MCPRPGFLSRLPGTRALVRRILPALLTLPLSLTFASSALGQNITSEQLSLAGPSELSEASGTVTYTVTLNPALDRRVRIGYDTQDISTRVGNDYDRANGTLTFGPGEVAKTFTVRIKDDDLDERDLEYFQFALIDRQNGDRTVSTHPVAIRDNEPTPAVTLTRRGNQGVLAESVGSVSFNLGLTGKSGLTVDVNVAASSGPLPGSLGSATAASAGEDFTAFRETFSFAPGEREKRFTIRILDDKLDENEEFFRVAVTSATNVNQTLPVRYVGLRDNDDPPEVYLAEAPRVTFGEVDIPYLHRLYVHLGAASGRPVQVRYESKDGGMGIPATQTTPAIPVASAIAGRDYGAVSGVLTFRPGETVQVIQVPVSGDRIDEPDEAFTLTIEAVNPDPSDPRSILGASQVEATIEDNDPEPLLTIRGRSRVIEGSSTVRIPVIFELSEESAFEASVLIRTVGVNATSNVDYGVLREVRLSFEPGATYHEQQIEIYADDLDEYDENFYIQARHPQNLRLDGLGRFYTTIADRGSKLQVTMEGPDRITESDEVQILTYTVTLDSIPSEIVGVGHAARTRDGNTATEDEDYALLYDGPIFFTHRTQLVRTFQVEIKPDDLDEDDETFDVFLVRQPGDDHFEVNPGSITVTIVDDDPEPKLLLRGSTTTDETSDFDGTVGEGDGTVYFIAELEDVSGRQVTADYTLSGFLNNGNPATAGTDYEALSGTLTIKPGDTQARVTVAIHDDNRYEEDEDFGITLLSPTNAILQQTSYVVQIEDNDGPPELTLTGPESVTEPDGTVTLTFTAELTPATGRTASVDYATAPGTATPGLDYENTSGRLSFLPVEGHDRIKTFDVTILADEIDELDETFTIELSNVVGAKLGEMGSVTVTIEDDDVPLLTLAGPGTVDEDAGDLEFTATLDISPAVDVTFQIAPASGGTARAPLDFLAQPREYRFLAGATEEGLSDTYTVTLVDDSEDEPDESFTIELQQLQGAGYGDPRDVTVTIEDNDVPEVAFSAATLTVKEQDGTAEVVVTVDRVPLDDVTVSYETRPDTATSADFTPVSGDLTFAAGSVGRNLTRTIEVEIDNDQLDELDESFTVVLLSDNLSGAVLGTPSTQTVTIEDNDVPLVTLSTSMPVVDEGPGSVPFRISVDRVPVNNISVSWETRPGTAVAGDFTSASGSATFAANTPLDQLFHDFSVEIGEDQIYETDESFTVALLSEGLVGADLGTPFEQTVTITDDESAPVASFAADAATSVGEGDGSVSLAVELDPVSAFPTVVSYVVLGTGSHPAAADDYAALDSLEIGFLEETGNIVIDIEDDDLDEENETFTVTITGAEGAELASHTVTITDDDPLPTVGITPVAAVREDVGTVSVEVALSAVSGKTVTVDYAVEDGTAKRVDDYAPVSPAGYDGTLTFAPGEQTKTLGFSIVADTIDEADTEEFTVSLAGPVNVALDPQASEQTVGINDDDGAPTVTLEGSSDPVPEGNPAPFKVTLNVPSGLDVVVTPGVTDGTAVSGTDYGDPVPASVTIIAGETEETFQVPTMTDELDEGDETFTVTIADADGNQLGSQVVTIEDDDEPAVTIAGPSQAVLEDDTATLTVTMSRESVDDTVVDYTIAGSGANPASADDYTASSGSFTIRKGDTTYDLDIPLIADSLVEPSETFTVTITGASGRAGPGAPASVEVTIADNGLPTADAGTDVNVAGGAPVTLDGSKSSDPETLAAGGTAGQGLTYQWTPPQGVTLLPDNTAAMPEFTAPDAIATARPLTFTLVVTDEANQVSESDSVIVTVNAKDGPALSGSIGPFTFAAVTATNTETLPTVDTDTGFGQITYKIDQTLPSGLSFDDTNRTISGAPTAAVPPGAGDYTYRATDEANRPATLEFSIIVTNDAPTAEAGSPQSVAGGATVTLDGSDSSDPETIAAGGAAGEGLTYAWTTTESGVTLRDHDTATPEFDAPDATAEAQSLTFTLVVTDEANQVSASDEVTITVTALPLLTLAGATQVNEGGGAVTYTVTLAPVASGPVTVDWSVDDGTTSPADYTIADDRTLTFAAGETSKTFDVTIADDSENEDAETFTVSLSSPVGAQLGASSRDVTIAASDGPRLSVADTVLEVDESSGAGTVAVTVEPVSRVDLNLTYAVREASPVSATAADFTAVVSATVTVPARADTVDIPFTVTGDNADEQNETFEVALLSVSGGEAMLGATTVRTVRILDDDSAPSFSNVGTPRTLTWAAIANNMHTLDTVNAGTGGGDVSYALGLDVDLDDDGAGDLGWLAFDAGTRTVSGTPPADVRIEAGDGVTLTYTATDEGNNTPATLEYPLVVTNDAPTAEAGTDQNVAGGATVTLDGSNSSDPETLAAGGTAGQGLTYQWTTTDSGVTLRDHDTATPEFDAPDATAEAQSLTFSLIVTDEANQVSASDDVIVTVNPVGAPVLSGPIGPFTWAAVTDTVDQQLPTVDTDTGFGEIAYSIDETLPGGLRFDATERKILGNVTADVVQDATPYMYRARDSVGREATHRFTIAVTNQEPVAEAGDPQAVAGGDTVTLNGSGSTDAESAPADNPAIRNLAYQWTTDSDVILRDHDTATPEFDAPDATAEAQSLTFTLVVTDEANQESESDDVIVMVNVKDGPALSGSIGPFTFAAVTATNTETLPEVDTDTGFGQITYKIDQTLPAGLSFDDTNRTLSGAPTAAVPPGAGDYTYRATDEANRDATLPFNIIVTNELPTAEAGADQNVAGGGTVTLDGSNSSDPETIAAGGAAGEGLTYEWTTTESGVTLRDHDTVTPEFDAPDATAEAQSLTFSLVVTDGANQVSAPDSVIITIDAEEPEAPAPTIPLSFGDATIPNQFWSEGQTIAALDLPAATGGIGEIRYTLDPDLPTGLSFNADARRIEGTLGAGEDFPATAFTYTATDSAQPPAMVYLEFNISVGASGPVADAGEDQTVVSSTLVTLDGRRSRDRETSTLEYRWFQVDGDPVTLEDRHTATPSFMAPTAVVRSQTLGFQLIVLDESRLSDTDEVMIVVEAPMLTVSGPFEVMEDVGEAVFTVTLSHSPGADVSAVVHARAVDNTARVAGTTGPPPDAPPVATASEDFVPTSLPLTFEAGATGADLSREFRVTILDDTGDEPDEIFTVALFRIDGALMEGLDRPSVTILDDDAPSFAGEVLPQVAFVGDPFRLELPPINGVGPFVYGMDRELPGGLVLSVVAWQPTSPNPLGALRNEGLSGDGLLDNGLLGNDASGNDVSGNDLNGDEPDGDLPDGLDIDPRRAVIEGTPTVTAPRSEFRVRAVSETTGDAVAMSFEFEVREPMIMAQTIPDQTFEAWVEVPPVTLPEAAGGLGELRYRLSPAPPDGLVFNADTRTLSGLPTRARERTEYTLVATDERGAEVQTAFDIIITPGMDPVLAPIADFLANRADTLVSNQPRLIPLLKQPGEEGLKDYGFRASEGNRSASGAFTHSGLWAEVAGAWQETDTSESRQVFATLGYHYQFSEQFLGGLMLQLDHMASDLNQGLGDIEGTGWLVGPYFVASLPDDPLFLEARVLVGESDNDVDIFGHGLRRDGEFNTERLLAQLRLEGEMILGGGTRIVPFLDLGYVEDDAKRFTDDTGRTAPGQKISLGRYETGLRFDFPILLETGSLRLSQELSYAYTDTDGGEYGASRTDARGRLTFELDYQRSESTRLWLETFYDGLGQSDMDSHGLKLGIEATFE